MTGRRGYRYARLLLASARWADRAEACAAWTRQGVERCRRWAREGAQRPGEMAPPSWFAIALPFGIGWYLAVGGVARAWCRVAHRTFWLLSRVLGDRVG